MSEKMARRGRINYIDVAKGISMICIILGHLNCHAINRVVYPFHVPIFFLITGYFTDPGSSFPAFVKKKARTLLVPYFITCLVIIVIGTLEGFVLGDPLIRCRNWLWAAFYGAGDSYTEPFYIKAIGAIWFLWATFWGSCFLKLSLRMNRYARILFLLLLFLLGYRTAGICWLPFSIQAGACAASFMYIGYLARLYGKAKEQAKLPAAFPPAEIKAAFSVFALLTYLFFIRDFQSFWLVHCDIGRGIADVFGSLCACWTVLQLSRLIDQKVPAAGRFFSYFGRYSLLFLCVHIIELDLFPWWQIADGLVSRGLLPASSVLLFIIVLKIPADLFCTYLLSRVPLVRKMLGYKPVTQIGD